jgi:predicted nucleic acid-binding protein
MPYAWDTTVASRAHADGRHEPLARAHIRRGSPILLPAPAVQEVARGLHAHTPSDARFALRITAFESFLAHPLVQVVPFDDVSALLAGELLASIPHPPTGSHRRHGTRAHQRAAWALDVQIAACAFAGGYGLLTENVADFTVLRDAIAQLAPGVPPLAVTDARALA